MAISKDIAIISFHCFRCSKAYLRKSIDLQSKPTPPYLGVAKTFM